MAVPSGPDPAASRRRYDSMAARYDRHLGLQGSRLGRYQEGLRKRAVEALALEPGQAVLDVGCGTGASFARLVAAVGPDGRVLGVDHSEGMLAVARRRISDAGWTNVELVDAPLEESAPPAVDAALLFFTHDLMRNPEALDSVTGAVRPRGRVVAAGLRRPSWWLFPVAAATTLAVRRYTTTREGLGRPWDLLEQRLEEVRSELLLLGTLYVLAGRRPPDGPR
jgi:ubiquinone/menaquinone biosynthesis C-methylase UbiE